MIWVHCWILTIYSFLRNWANFQKKIITAFFALSSENSWVVSALSALPLSSVAFDNTVSYPKCLLRKRIVNARMLWMIHSKHGVWYAMYLCVTFFLSIFVYQNLIVSVIFVNLPARLFFLRKLAWIFIVCCVGAWRNALITNFYYSLWTKLSDSTEALNFFWRKEIRQCAMKGIQNKRWASDLNETKRARFLIISILY